MFFTWLWFDIELRLGWKITFWSMLISALVNDFKYFATIINCAFLESVSSQKFGLGIALSTFRHSVITKWLREGNKTW